MKCRNATRAGLWSARSVGLVWVGAAAWLVSSCGSGALDGRSQSGLAPLSSIASSVGALSAGRSPEQLSVGSIQAHPGAGGHESQQFLLDEHLGGRGTELRIARLAYGRSVDVYGLDPAGGLRLEQRDFVIGAQLVSDGADYRLEDNAIVGQERLVILRDVTDAAPGGGLDQFLELLARAGDTLDSIVEAGPGSGGIFSTVPRDATIVVQFDDLVDPETVNAESFVLRTGSGTALAPFEGRIISDPNYGGLVRLAGEGGARFLPTRVQIQPSVSVLDAAVSGLPENGAGLPLSSSASVTNLELRIPTTVDTASGQATVLRSAGGATLASSGHGPVDFESPTVDVVRLARSGGLTSVTGDAFNGMLEDLDPPQVVGMQPIVIGRRPRPLGTGNPLEFRLRQIRFASRPCAFAARVGDIISVAGFFAEVIAPASLSGGGQVFGLEIRLLAGDPVAFRAAAIGPAEYRTTFDPVADAGRAPCFIEVQPTPGGFPEVRNLRLQPESTFAVTFTEALGVPDFEPHETLAVTRAVVPVGGVDFVVGSISPSADLATFTFVPTLPLAHLEGSAEGVFVTLGAGDTGVFAPTDLAGNALVDFLPQVAYRLDPDCLLYTSPSPRDS